MSIVRNILVRVGADVSEFEKSLTKASKAMTKAGQELKTIGANLTTAITLPLAAIAVGSIKTAADFEEGMSKIKAVSGSTGEEMEALKKIALEMGAKTKYSAKEAASGIEELIKAGVSVKDILGGGLEGALNLAAAGEIELADAAIVASTALNAFKKDSISVTQAADILAGAANASATDIAGLSLGLSAVAAVSAGVGMSFKDTSTALAVFAQNGLKGSDAGTSLKTMLLNLQPQTKEQKKAFEELGLTTANGSSAFYDATGKLKSLSDISGLLQTSMKGMTDAQRISTMEVMFGTDAIRAANIMFGEGSAGIDKMTTEMLKFTAADVAKEKMNNLKGQIEEMKGSLETAGIQLGTIFIPLLRDLVTNYIQPAIDKFAGLSTEMQKKIVIIAGVVAAIGPLMWILGQTITTVTTVISLVKNLGVVFTLLTGPIGIVVVAIAALVAAVIYMWNTNETFRTNVIACWEMIKAAAIGIFNGIKIFWDEWGATIIEFFKIWGSGVLGFITYLMNTMMNSIRTILELIGGIIKFFTAVFQGDWQGAWEAMQEIGTTILNFIKRQIEIVIEAIVGVFARLGIDLPAMWSSMWYSVWSTVDSIVSRIVGIIDAVIGKVLSVIDAIRNFNAMEVATKVFRTVHETVNTVIQAASNIIPHAAGGIFTKPTLLGNHLFGEAGDEALIPLNKLDNMISGGSGDRPIIVYLEGKKIYEGLDSYLGNRLVGLGAI